MSYRTDFYIEVGEADEETLSKISPIILGFDDEGFKTAGPSFFSGYDLRWDNQIIDMFILSKAYPSCLFTVQGYGENRDDIWVEYWKNGCCQAGVAELPEFDESKLIPYELDGDCLVVSSIDNEAEVNMECTSFEENDLF